MDPVESKRKLEYKHFKLSGDLRKIKPPPVQERFYVKFLELLEHHQEDMATVFKAVIHNG